MDILWLAALTVVSLATAALGFATFLLTVVGLWRGQEVRQRGYTANHNYIIYDHTRNAIIGDIPATVAKDGGVIGHRLWGIDPKYAGDRVRLLAILSDGEDSGLF